MLGRNRILFCLVSVLGASVAHAQTVVIDPGHGGGRPGTQSASGTLEKTVALSIAKHARRALSKKGVRVVLTREEDRGLGLSDRVRIANREAAVAFVSIHANYAPVPERRGAEVYILSARATDDAALLLAHLEDAGDEEGRFVNEEEFGGGVVDREEGDLDFILADLERSWAHRESSLLARKVGDSMGTVRGLRPARGLRQAPFKVLKGARMAAALVEVGYLSNPAQAAFLSTGRGQKNAGYAIARGVLQYLKVMRK